MAIDNGYDVDNQNSKKPTVFSHLYGNQSLSEKPPLFLKDGVVYADIPIEDIGLSNRAYLLLKRNGINSLLELANKEHDYVMKLKNMGKTTLAEIYSVFKDYVVISNADYTGIDELVNKYKEVFASHVYDGYLTRIEAELKNYFVNNHISGYGDREILEILVHMSFFEKLFRDLLLGVYPDDFKLEKRLDDIFSNELSRYKKEYLNRFINEGILDTRNNRLIFKQISFKEFVEGIENERDKNCIIDKVEGMTLEEIGVKYGITRERIRQIILRAIQRRPPLMEDADKWIFEKYNIEREACKNVFQLDDYSIFYYENILQNKARLPIEQILEDDNVSLSIKKAIKGYIYREYVDANGIYVKCERGEILSYILRTYCKEEVSVGDVKYYYDCFLASYGLGENADLQYPDRYFESKLAISRDILWKFGMNLRYYYISDEDFSSLLDDINFYSLKDIEISTQYFFDRYREILKEYDIWDEYELHNLLKKRLEGKVDGLLFLRMPMISFGEANRDQQVIDLLMQCAPISSGEFAEKYRERYGVHAATVLSNYTKCIDVYYHSGSYSIDYEELSSEENDYLKNKLERGEVHELTTIQRLFQKQFDSASSTKVSSYALKKLGYRVSENIIFKSDGRRVEAFFRDYFDKDYVDLREKRWILSNQMAKAALDEKKKEFDLLEVSPYEFYSYKSQEHKLVDKMYIIDFYLKGIEYAKGEVFNTHSLKYMGFKHILLEMYYDEYFFDSIFRTCSKCVYSRAGGKYIFHEQQGKLSVSMFLEKIVEDKAIRTIDELKDYLISKYAIELERYKLKEYLNKSSLVLPDEGII